MYGGDAWWIPVFSSSWAAGSSFIFGRGGAHRDAAGFEAGAEETEKYEARCVGQEPRLL